MWGKPLWIVLLLVANQCVADIAPWKENPRYWSDAGKPLLLLGGSDDDSLFQLPEQELIAQLDRLQQAGGNLVRNTMSDRRERGFEIYPYLEIAPGKYDLDQWNPEYWARFDRFLQETAKRNIFVQIELWDRFDFSDHGTIRHWKVHPYNPRNNVNYSYWKSGFVPHYYDHPGKNKQPFFFTTPQQRNNKLMLAYQQRFIDRVLHYTLRYGHVLYCIDNETKADRAWSNYWARYIKTFASARGKRIYVTEMMDDRTMDILHHGRTLQHPELYDFVEVSQNNHNSGDRHWRNLQRIRGYLAASPRPMNAIKVYGAAESRYGTSNDALARFWLNILGGASAVRFHRPPTGLGTGEEALLAIQTARQLEGKFSLWEFQPIPLSRERHFYMASDGNRYLIYLPAGHTFSRDVMPEGANTLSWVDVSGGDWQSLSTESGDGRDLLGPGERDRLLLLE